MKLLLIFLSMMTAFLSLSAFAANSPQFSFEDAQKAFEVAKPPTLKELLGNWALVGYATKDPLDDSASGYWPDGNVLISGQAGYFNIILEISTSLNAFKKPVIQTKGLEIGAETKKVYLEYNYSATILTATGLEFQSPSDAPGCAGKAECRVVAETGMLLCARKTIDERSGCETYGKEPNAFRGYLKK